MTVTSTTKTLCIQHAFHIHRYCWLDIIEIFIILSVSHDRRDFFFTAVSHCNTRHCVQFNYFWNSNFFVAKILFSICAIPIGKYANTTVYKTYKLKKATWQLTFPWWLLSSPPLLSSSSLHEYSTMPAKLQYSKVRQQISLKSCMCYPKKQCCTQMKAQKN